ncbi:uncharacterized protein LOC110681492 [Aedes aegypti]|uniref:Uncharacterized protein n=1 Tax=Aedes aegypti TaxID=7159 RepID=A0A6I8U7V8_AEDAE|nr:uncharacterized protein LOC5578979 [Aedes aegypti]XP_021712984.1 uncharacterized protein LOC110681492 [Aedes aegypti]
MHHISWKKMSSSESHSSISGTATSSAVSFSNQLTPEYERSLAQRMLQYVYDRSAIVTARQLAFWERFRQQAPDVEMFPQDLRAMFYGEVLYEPEHFEDLEHAVTNYINPRFNQIQLEALEFGDLAEQEDYMLNLPRNVPLPDGEMNFEQLVNYISNPFEASRNSRLVPLNVQLVAAPQPSADANLKQRFCHLLSELVYTRDETVEKPTLAIEDICERVSVLTAKGIRLDDLIEPGMECYKLLNGINPETETPNVPVPEKATVSASDQVVPVVPTSSALKRWKSFDDSGLGNTPPKQRRMNPPSSLLARRQHGRVRRIVSAPSNSLM